jgi:hypothetical protein
MDGAVGRGEKADLDAHPIVYSGPCLSPQNREIGTDVKFPLELIIEHRM